MRLGTCAEGADGAGGGRFVWLRDGRVYDVGRAAARAGGDALDIPASLKGALGDWQRNLDRLRALDEAVGDDPELWRAPDEVRMMPPVPEPRSFRDFYAFESHVRAACKLRGADIHPRWYELPVFYFSNPAVLYGHGADVPAPGGVKELDYELEIAVIIADGGGDIRAGDAARHIGGYTICNDWSARDLQRDEMAMNLGPAKGKDFATSFGPWMVTADELGGCIDGDGRVGLKMTASRNGRQLSAGDSGDMHHLFPAMIERASRGSRLVAGDYLGSGTVGTGCILELRPEHAGGWLAPGDVVRLDIEHLGALENRII